MKNTYLILLIPVLFIFGCDSQQNSAPVEKVETTASTSIQNKPVADKVQETTVDTVAASTQVEAKAVDAPLLSADKAPMSGKQVYEKFCINCHKSGVANAPKLGNANDWSPRIAKGESTLYQSAKLGVPGTAMMAKGTCSMCSEAELEATVDFMISNSK